MIWFIAAIPFGFIAGFFCGLIGIALATGRKPTEIAGELAVEILECLFFAGVALVILAKIAS